MSLQDSYGKLIGKGINRDEFNGLSDDELYEKIKSEYKIKFAINSKHVKKIVDALPKSYKASAERIAAQSEISDQLHEEMFRTEYEMKFNKTEKTLSHIPQVDRGLRAFYQHVLEFGSPENKKRINDIYDKINKNYKDLEEAEANDKYSIDIKNKLQDNAKELENFGKEIAVSQIRDFAKDVKRINDLIIASDDPKKLLENYKEIRKYATFFADSKFFLEPYKNLFDSDEYENLSKTFTQLHTPAMEILNHAGSLANPMIAKNIDIDALKMVPVEDLNAVLEDSATWEELSDDKNNPIDEDLKFEKFNIASAQLYNLTLEPNAVYSEWLGKIYDKFGISSGEIDILDIDGNRKSFTPEVMLELYNDSVPFYAIPKDAPINLDNVSSMLCIPTAGHHLACGEDEIKALKTDVPNRAKPHKPSSFAFAWDSFISSISSKFRVSSVKKYEDELALYYKDEELRLAAAGAKKMCDEPEIKAIAHQHALDVFGLTDDQVKNMKEERDLLRDSFNYDAEEVTNPEVDLQDKRLDPERKQAADGLINDVFDTAMSKTRSYDENVKHNQDVAKSVDDDVTAHINDVCKALEAEKEDALTEAYQSLRDAYREKNPRETSHFAKYFVRQLVLDEINAMSKPYKAEDKQTVDKLIKSIDKTAHQELLHETILETINKVRKEDKFRARNPEEIFGDVKKSYMERRLMDEKQQKDIVIQSKLDREKNNIGKTLFNFSHNINEKQYKNETERIDKLITCAVLQNISDKYIESKTDLSNEELLATLRKNVSKINDEVKDPGNREVAAQLLAENTANGQYYGTEDFTRDFIDVMESRMAASQINDSVSI